MPFDFLAGKCLNPLGFTHGAQRLNTTTVVAITLLLYIGVGAIIALLLVLTQ